VQLDEPVEDAYLPATQDVQLVDAVAPVKVIAVPEEQLVQPDEPAIDEYLPPTQDAQLDKPALEY
jgi:hypothetical protein